MVTRQGCLGSGDRAPRCERPGLTFLWTVPGAADRPWIGGGGQLC